MPGPREFIRCAYRDAEGFRQYWSAELAEANRNLIGPMDLRGAISALDVGSGIGLGVAALREAAPQSRIFAVDLVEDMIRVVPADVARACMDGQALGFADATFDVVVMAFMLFHVPEPARALAEVRRVLRPGGRVAIGTWELVEAGIAADEAWFAALDGHGAPAVPDSVSGHDLMDSPEKIAALVSSAGFTDVDSRTVDLLDHIRDANEYLIRRTTLGVSSARFNQLPDDAKESVIAAVRPKLEAISDFDVTERAILTWARRD